jgi:cyclin B
MMITRRQAAAAQAEPSQQYSGKEANGAAMAARAKRTAFGEIGNKMQSNNYDGTSDATAASNTIAGKKRSAEPVAASKQLPASVAAHKNAANGDVVMEDAEHSTGVVVVASAQPALLALPYIERLPAIDRPDMADPRFVAEYVGEIFQNMRRLENKYQAPADYLTRCSSDINERMRGVLVDWLVEVHYKFKLYPETLFLCVSLMDRYLAKKLTHVARSTLQLVGVTCLLIASKYEDIYAPEFKDIVHICDRTYRKEEILTMEVNILNTLQFEITAPSPLLFLLRLGKAMRCDEKHFYLAQYCLELALPDYKLWLRYSPSLLASGALYLANKLLRLSPAWPAHVMQTVEHPEAAVKSCAKEICLLLQNTEECQLKAVRKKFSQPKFHTVAKLVL